MIEIVSSIAVLAVVILGVLVIVQAVSPSEALRFVVRALLVLFLAVFALYALKFFGPAFSFRGCGPALPRSRQRSTGSRSHSLCSLRY